MTRERAATSTSSSVFRSMPSVGLSWELRRGNSSLFVEMWSTYDQPSTISRDVNWVPLHRRSCVSGGSRFAGEVGTFVTATDILSPEPVLRSQIPLSRTPSLHALRSRCGIGSLRLRRALGCIGVSTFVPV